MYMEYDELYELVKARRNIRSFSDEPVDDETIEKILRVARRAPSGANSQPWEFIVVTDDDLRKEVYDIYVENYVRRMALEGVRDREYRFWGPNAPSPAPESFAHPLAQAPVYLLQIGDSRTTECYNWAATNSMRHRLSNYYSSMANANLLVHLGAASLGLGSKYDTLSGERDVEGQLKMLLDIPDVYDTYELIALGYYDYDPSPTWRQDLEDIVHWNEYNRDLYRDDNEMDEFVKSNPMDDRES